MVLRAPNVYGVLNFQQMNDQKWQANIEEDKETGDYYITFPPDLLEKVGWKEGDLIDWSKNEDGTWSLTKKDA